VFLAGNAREKQFRWCIRLHFACQQKPILRAIALNSRRGKATLPDLFRFDSLFQTGPGIESDDARYDPIAPFARAGGEPGRVEYSRLRSESGG